MRKRARSGHVRIWLFSQELLFVLSCGMWYNDGQSIYKIGIDQAAAAAAPARPIHKTGKETS